MINKIKHSNFLALIDKNGFFLIIIYLSRSNKTKHEPNETYSIKSFYAREEPNDIQLKSNSVGHR
jgi:hypothetical protein